MPWTTGSREPTGPIPTVWIRVATPAASSAICTSTVMYSGPAASAMMSGTVMFPANIARTCWMPRGMASPIGGR